MSETPAGTGVTYRPRNDCVLLRMDRVEQLGRVYMPEASVQGHRYVVHAIGPQVENLNVGDVVFPTGQIGLDIAPLPNDSKMFLTRQINIAVVLEPAKDVH